MIRLTRREALGVIGAATLVSRPARGGPELTKLSLLLNSGYSGANAWFPLAEDQGNFRRAGLEIAFTAGRGAYTAAPRLATEPFDVGYGDINALIEVAGRNKETAPIAVFMVFDQSPSAIAVAADGPIKTRRDLEGRTLIGHATDVALNTFGAYAKRGSIAAERVTIKRSESGMGGLIEEMRGGRVDGVFGYVTTITAAARTLGLDPKLLRFLTYRDVVPELYGSALMVSKRLRREQPEVVRALVQAVRLGIEAARAKPDEAIVSTLRRAPEMKAEIERERLLGTFAGEMAHAGGRKIGLGDVDDARLRRAMSLIAETNYLPRVPALAEVFTREFLPAR